MACPRSWSMFSSPSFMLEQLYSLQQLHSLGHSLAPKPLVSLRAAKDVQS